VAFIQQTLDGFERTGEFRAPRKGEFIIPQDYPNTVHRASVDYIERREILRPVGTALVSMIHTEAKVSIDLSKLDKGYPATLVITVEQATQLLRELDAVIL